MWELQELWSWWEWWLYIPLYERGLASPFSFIIISKGDLQEAVKTMTREECNLHILDVITKVRKGCMISYGKLRSICVVLYNRGCSFVVIISWFSKTFTIYFATEQTQNTLSGNTSTLLSTLLKAVSFWVMISFSWLCFKMYGPSTKQKWNISYAVNETYICMLCLVLNIGWWDQVTNAEL